MKKSTIGVLGIGEIGTAISEIFKKNFIVLKKDLNFDEIKNNKLEVLHVCIPYGNKFQDIVIQQTKRCSPALVIIHSTVKPGTTTGIFRKTKTLTVHSPVMGAHPNLKGDMLKFTKFIGPVNIKAQVLAVKHFKSVGIKIVSLNSPGESEIGKLLDTTYYAWNILFNKIVAQMCKELKVDFDHVYTKFNTVYNRGYNSTKPNVIRPVLKFTKGPIGGHCVMPNARILSEFKKSILTDLILKYDRNLSKKKSS
jgi:UDP-N-acetyl-D-mannosaminuronate dehydrogenase